MNAKTRHDLQSILDKISDCISELEGIRDEEQSKFDNMPEVLQVSERGEIMDSAIDSLQTAIDDAEGVKTYIEEAMS